ncbi:MAG: hypothetical protein M1814_001162 [Vezdaea aestivalis]|nr:MAG: hypothetical protein M1814_001162 [Vezdaea aestivalis]
MAASPTPRRASARRATTSTPPRAALLVAEALFADKPIKRKKSIVAVESPDEGLASPQRAKSKLKRQSLDLGKPLGPFDNNSVRNRVRKWQAQGGGVVNQIDLVEYPPEVTPVASEAGTDQEKDSNGEPLKFEGPMKTRTRKDAKLKAKEEVCAKETKTPETRDDHNASPKKRVVSDSNWRKKKATGGDGTSGMGQKRHGPRPPSPKLDDGIRITPVREDSASARRRRKKRTSLETSSDHETHPNAVDDTPSRGGSSARSMRRQDLPRTPSRRPLDLDGIRVYSTPLKSADNLLERPKNSSRSFSDSRRKRGEDRATSPLPVSPPTKRTVSSESQQSTPKQWSPTSAAALNARKHPLSVPKPRKPSYSQDKPQDSSRKPSPRGLAKVSILREVYDEGKKMFAKAPEAPPLHRSGQRIEAWLNETSDPFFDDPPASIIDVPPQDACDDATAPVVSEQLAPYPDLTKMEPNEKAKSIRSESSRRKRRSRTPIDQDEGTLEATHDPEGSVTPARLMADEHIPPPNIVDTAPSITPQSLRRTGAKRGSPTHSKRSSPLEDSFIDRTINEEDDSAPPLLRDLRPPGLFERRPFPQTGAHRLSTIASIETLSTHMKHEPAPTIISETSQKTARPAFSDSREDAPNKPDGLLTLGKTTSLKRRLTTHADLISVLSLPKAGNESIISARSIRTNRSKLSTATIADILKELATDETKYMRELRTLVDGVIPVLLTCVLSKTDSAVAAGLFSRSASGSEDPAITRPIVDMGIALERLKVLHKRIPLHDAERLLTWALGAQKVYQEYLKAWRMGFQDVVVNLAPSVETNDDRSIYEGLPRNAQGDVINGDGERVDVAFLLKRPLVRLKYLSKTFKGLNFVKPSFSAADMATKYEGLVAEARTRSNEERARLEDEAAANIDSTRARDPRTLAPMTYITIERSRRVRARDCFNLEMQHSSGQRLDCRVELFLRDNAPENGLGGDLLVCEMDATGRWLLLPPVSHAQMSARNGDRKGEIVLMFRGFNSQGQEWHELISLVTEDEETGFEWVQMIGLTPIPPAIERSQSFIKRHNRSQSALVPAYGGNRKSRTPSPTEIEIPIGENAQNTSVIEAASIYDEPLFPQPNSQVPKMEKTPPSRGSASPRPAAASSTHPETTVVEVSPDLNDAMRNAGESTTPKLRRQRARKYSRAADGSPNTPKPSRLSLYLQENSLSSPVNSYEGESEKSLASSTVSRLQEAKSLPQSPEPKPRRERERSVISGTTSDEYSLPVPNLAQPRKRTSSAPSIALPLIPKVRKSNPAELDQVEDGRLDTHPTSSQSTPTKKSEPDRYQKRHNRMSAEPRLPGLDTAPPPPPHKSNPRDAKVPKLVSTTSPSQFTPKHRRSSSPLKHEYEPSTASDSSVSEDSYTEEDCDTLSDATSDGELEDGDVPTPLPPLDAMQKIGKITPQASIYSLPNGSLGPSQSASQAPFRSVPPQPHKASRTIASIFSWSDKGSWESLHPEECSVVITPGLIEAFKMSASHSRPPTANSPKFEVNSNSNQRPLVALELTPLVPLRRGTALDISIRSPPTPQSLITSGSNIMFRSRSTEECEALYALINQSRINNPTYIALSNARAHTETLHRLERQTSARHSGSRWGWGSRSSYRATSSGRGPGSTTMSESSVGSLASAFSALRRFGTPGAPGSRLFNISKSTVSSRAGGVAMGGSRTNSLYSSSSGSSTPMPPLPEGMKLPTPGIGLSNLKIRLYHRESANRWRDMGSARLTIRLPPPSAQIATSVPVGAGAGEAQKRILVIGKTKGECLLDVCLGGSCFERIARTGIAISIWEEVFGPNGEAGQIPKEGGVGSGRRGVYMVQMKSEAETAYTFSLVGKLRY